MQKYRKSPKPEHIESYLQFPYMGFLEDPLSKPLQDVHFNLLAATPRVKGVCMLLVFCSWIFTVLEPQDHRKLLIRPA